MSLCSRFGRNKSLQAGCVDLELDRQDRRFATAATQDRQSNQVRSEQSQGARKWRLEALASSTTPRDANDHVVVICVRPGTAIVKERVGDVAVSRKERPLDQPAVDRIYPPPPMVLNPNGTRPPGTVAKIRDATAPYEEL
jgi:hypothetical protein